MRVFGAAVLLTVLSQILAQQATPTPRLAACDLPAETGPCLANMVRWHFDSDSGQCEKFSYGGCEGNENNFFTKGHCLNFAKRCMKHDTPHSGGWSRSRRHESGERDSSRGSYGWHEHNSEEHGWSREHRSNERSGSRGGWHAHSDEHY